MTLNSQPARVSATGADVRTTPPASIYIITGLSALGGLLFGFDTGVISGAQLFLIKTFQLNTLQQSIAVSIALVGAVIGALCVGRMNDALGRRKTMIILAILFIVGALLTAFAPDFLFFLSVRIVVGFAFGASASAVPVYISEVAPPALRGAMVTMNQLAITVGIAVSYWVDLAFAHAGLGWPPMFGIAALPGIIFLLGMLFNPETPRWLGMQSKWEEARHVLERLRGTTDVDLELEGIRSTLSQKGRGTLRTLLAPGLRGALVVGIGLAVFQQFVGINTIIYYAPTIFQSAGISSADSAILATGIVGILNVVVTIVALMLIDRVGRRTLLFVGTVGMVVALIALGTIFALGPQNAGVLTLIALLVYIASFALGFGPVFWLMSAEIFPTHVRATGSSISAFCNWAANLLISVTFLLLIKVIGAPFTFWSYAIMGILAFIFCYILVPETKGKTLEQIAHYWQNGHHWDKVD
jgi:SP family galactose:H+ symporter-like MFS transporter